MSTSHFKSYQKTLALAAIGGSVAFVSASALARPQWGRVALIVLSAGWLIGGLFALLVLSGVVVLLRDMHQRRTGTNLFRVLLERRSERVVARGAPDAGLWWRRVLRRAIGVRGFAVGETVEVKSYDEIVKTLGADGAVDAMPFLPEMKKFCGRRARVFRKVDKVYDYGGAKVLRRLDDAYLLTYMRCDGSAHGGCQASCYLLWKSDWLKRAPSDARADYALAAATLPPAPATPIPPIASPGDPGARYRCQFTQLVAASSNMSKLDVRQDLRPLVSGNITLAAFCLAVLTRFFNYAQRLRGGVGYPAMPARAGGRTARIDLGLEPGEHVRVHDAETIAATLDAGSRNRGLWFDKDMLKYCGQSCTVRKRVDRIIDDATGLMRVMRTPCIVLQDVDYTGETLRFAPQEEHLYWREAWLARLDASTATAAGERGDQGTTERAPT